MNKCAHVALVALALITKQVHHLMTAHGVKTVPFKINGTDPTAALIVYGAPVCIECGPESCLSMQ